MFNDIPNFVKTWVFKSDRGSVAQEKNTLGYPLESHQAPQIYTLLNWTVDKKKIKILHILVYPNGDTSFWNLM